MTHEQFLTYFEHPEQLSELQMQELKELMEKFPYFAVAHWMYLRTLKNTNSIFFGSEIYKTALYTYSRRNLYYYIHPEEKETRNQRERIFHDGSYFDMLDKIELPTKNEEENKNSLKSLAEKLKAARQNFNG